MVIKKKFKPKSDLRMHLIKCHKHFNEKRAKGTPTKYRLVSSYFNLLCCQIPHYDFSFYIEYIHITFFILNHYTKVLLQKK